MKLTNNNQRRLRQSSSSREMISSSSSLLPMMLLLLLLSLTSVSSAASAAATATTTTSGFTSLLLRQQHQQRGLQTNNNLDNIPYPFQRFKLWDDLTSGQIANARDCSYIEESWNLPSSNEIELLSFETIEMQQQNFQQQLCFPALIDLGFNESSWDCYMNHYIDYSWEELIEYNVNSYWEDLGWNQRLWDGNAGSEGSSLSAPSTNDMFWSDLSNREKTAANQLCYTERLWDGLDSFDNWPSALLPDSPSPTPFPTIEPTISPAPSTQPTSEPTSQPTLTPYPTISPAPTSLPSSQPSTQQPSESQQPTITQQPSSSPISQPTPMPTTRQADSTVSVYKNKRYIIWSNIHPEIKQYAAKLFYNEPLWNTPGTAKVELLSYWSITTDSESYPEGIVAMEGIGFNSEEWDCHVNHYGDYAWSDLEDVDVAKYWIDLGWSQIKWDEGGSASTDLKYWDELTDKERTAAEQLCYQCELWNQIPLDDWNTKRSTGCRQTKSGAAANNAKSPSQSILMAAVSVGIGMLLLC